MLLLLLRKKLSVIFAGSFAGSSMWKNTHVEQYVVFLRVIAFIICLFIDFMMYLMYTSYNYCSLSFFLLFRRPNLITGLSGGQAPD